METEGTDQVKIKEEVNDQDEMESDNFVVEEEMVFVDMKLKQETEDPEADSVKKSSSEPFTVIAPGEIPSNEDVSDPNNCNDSNEKNVGNSSSENEDILRCTLSEGRPTRTINAPKQYSPSAYRPGPASRRKHKDDSECEPSTTSAKKRSMAVSGSSNRTGHFETATSSKQIHEVDNDIDSDNGDDQDDVDDDDEELEEDDLEDPENSSYPSLDDSNAGEHYRPRTRTIPPYKDTNSTHSDERIWYVEKCFTLEKDSDSLFQVLKDGEISDIEDVSDDENEEYEEDKFQRRREMLLVNGSEKDSDSDTDDVFAPKKNIKWQRRVSSFDKKNFTYFPGEEAVLSTNTRETRDSVKPLRLFMKYLPQSLFEIMSEKTNQYAKKKNPAFTPTTATELKNFFGIHIFIGCLKLSCIDIVYDFSIMKGGMTTDRIYELRRNLHLVDEKPDSADRLYKVRPIFDAVVSRCRELPLEENLSIAEQLVVFKGDLDTRFNECRARPLGVKIFVLCGKDGLVYDFVLSQGKTTEIEGVGELGPKQAAVKHLIDRIPVNKFHKLHVLPNVSSYDLLEECLDRGILAVMMLKPDSCKMLPLTSDYDLKLKGKGCFDEVVSEDGRVAVVKWYKGGPICLASSFVGVGTKDVIAKWNKVHEKFTYTERPEVVKLFHSSTRGIIHMQDCMEQYKTVVKSRKWVLKMVMHAVDMALFNAWLEYCYYAEESKVPMQKRFEWWKFRTVVAADLIREGKEPKSDDNSSKRRFSNLQDPSEARRSIASATKSRFDGIAHFPESTGKSIRCAVKGCSGFSSIQCTKCKASLCLKNRKNCFLDYHVESE